MAIDTWFLSAGERDNPFTRLTYRRGGASWSSGNDVRALVHGASYFARLHEVVEQMRAEDLLLFTDWRGDAEERLAEDGPGIGDLLAGAAARGVLVRGLFWRSHSDALHLSEGDNRRFAQQIRRAGGQVILDERVAPMGCHHQKLLVARHPGRSELDVAFVGGIDLCRTRRDDERHLGDPQVVSMGKVWGAQPAWHDVMAEIRGPAVGDVEANFRERWEDPSSPAATRINRIDALIHRDENRAAPLPAQLPDPEAPGGTQHVQILRTFPKRHPRFPFAPDGERSIARAYEKATAQAESLICLEDQYVWSPDVVRCFADALRAQPGLRMLIVLSTFTTADTPIANASAMGSRGRALAELRAAGGDRVAVYGIENEAGTPVYVHAKVCVIDDVWMTIGSDNVNLRSWTYDSELTCAVIDAQADARAPVSLRADGEPAGRLPRAVRLQLAREHLGRAEGDDADLADPAAAFAAFAACADALDAWHAGGRVGPRPPGRLRRYRAAAIPRRERLIGDLVYRFADDPDGRPRALRREHRF